MIPEYSIVIPVLNLSSSIGLLLRCLENQEYPHDRFECIFVDDGSTDGTPDILRAYGSKLQCQVVAHPANCGRSQARNTGWKLARGATVVFLDADMLPCPQWLAGYAKSDACNGALGIISGGRYALSIGSKDSVHADLARAARCSEEMLFPSESAAKHFECLHSSAILGQYPSPLFYRLETELREVCRAFPESLICAYSLVTSNVAVRRKLLEEVGGFDPFLRRAEDTSLGLQLWEQGAKFGFAEQAKAYHLYIAGETGRDLTSIENLAFFYRHPYVLVALMHLWCMAVATGRNRRSPRVPPSLVELARYGDRMVGRELARRFAPLFASAAFAGSEFTKEFLREYFAEMVEEDVDVGAYLDQAIAQGLYAIEREGATFMDVYHTSNWLRTRTTFEEHCLQHSSHARTHKTRYQTTHDLKDLACITYRGMWRVKLPFEHFRNSSEGSLNISIPIEHPNQRGVRLLECTPGDLFDYLDYENGLIANYPLERCRASDSQVGYSFECTVHEAAEGLEQAAGVDDLKVYLKPCWNPEYQAKAERLLQKISLVKGGDTSEQAHAIYVWLLDNTSYYESPFPSPSCVDTGFGSCVHLSGLFVALCRLAGIPARERTGALLAKGTGLAIETRTRGFSPFVHVWAEFYIRSGRWIPVDFVGWGYGRRLLTSHNVKDPHLRSEMMEDTALYDRYYFGCLDPFRIYSAPAANKAPFYVFNPSIKEQGAGQSRYLQTVLSHTHHLLSCTEIAASNKLHERTHHLAV